MSQMVNLLEMCLTSIDDDIQPGDVLHSTIKAVNAVHKVYVGMQVCCSVGEGLYAIYTPRAEGPRLCKSHLYCYRFLNSPSIYDLQQHCC